MIKQYYAIIIKMTTFYKQISQKDALFQKITTKTLTLMESNLELNSPYDNMR